MKNLIQQKNDLKNLFSDQQLIKEMQMPSGVYDQFLVLTELQRRKRIDDDQARKEATDDTKTVAQEVVNAAGVPQSGIAQLASTMNAKTDNTQNTGVQKMADGGVVKMQTAGKPPSIMSNIMSLMSPPSYDVANINKNEAIAPFVTPKETGLEAIEGQFLEEEQRKAVELQQAVLNTAKAGKTVGEIAKLLEIEVRDAANIIAGSAAYILTQTGGYLPQIYGIVKEANEKGSGLEAIRLGKTIRIEGKEFAFRDGLLLPRVADYNPFDERAKLFNKKTKEQLEEEERLSKIRAKFASMGALAQFDYPVELGGKEGTTASESIFSEGTPSLPITGKYELPRTFAGTNIGPFGEGPPRLPTNQLAAPQGDVFASGPLVTASKPESAVRPSVAEEISRLGRPIQTSISQQPPNIDIQGMSDDTLFTNVSRADEPFKLGGKALEEAEAKKAAQIRELLASETTPVPFRVGPAEMSKSSPIRPGRVVASDYSAYDFDPANQREATLAGAMPETEDMKQQVLSDILKSYELKGPFGRLTPIPKYDEFGDLIQPPERIQGLNPRGKTLKELQSEMGLIGIPDYGDAMSDLTGRAADYFKDARLGRLNQSPEEVYGDPSTAYLPSSVRDYFAQTLENQQAGIPGGNTPEATMAMNLENAARLREENLANPQLPLSLFQRSKMYLEGLGRDISGLSQEDIIEFAKKAGMKAVDLFDTGTTILADKVNEIQEQRSDQQKDRTTGKFDAPEASGPSLSEELVELRDQQQALFNKQLQQVGKSDAALAEFLGGLEKDREFDKAMALANAGAALMMPSATIGEGLGKAIKAGTKTLQKGKDSYNKNKLQVLALQGRIDAAKAAAANRAAIAGGTVSSRILLAQRDEKAKQLNILAPFGAEPDAANVDAVKKLRKEIADIDRQLDALTITTALGGIGAGNNDIAASYNLVG